MRANVVEFLKYIKREQLFLIIHIIKSHCIIKNVLHNLKMEKPMGFNPLDYEVETPH